MSEQAEQLDRVGRRISGAIMEFTATRTDFHADDLRAYVTAKVGHVAPGSADRVLRDLRKKGSLDYTVTNRRESLYRMLPLLSP